jgi:chlorophyll synthase
MWAFGCGLVSAGQPLAGRWHLIPLGIALTGPMVCGTSQAVNDWFDRHVDAINEPHRPIPSGRIPGTWGLTLAVIGTLGSLGLSLALGVAAVTATALALVLAWGYSAPPVRLKVNGWWGNAAVGFSYEGLAWVTGAAVVLGGRIPSHAILAVAALYSLGAHGIMTLNDFKSIEGDLRMGIGSLPARLGPERAARVACVMMLVPQLVVIALLGVREQGVAAGLVGLVTAAQVPLMRRLLTRPRELAPWYNATGISLYVSGMMITAVALRLGHGA